MKSFLTFFSHAIIVLSMLAAILAIGYYIFKKFITNQMEEGFILILAVIFAFIIYYVSMVYILPIPELLAKSMLNAGVISFSVIASSIGSTAAGMFMGGYIIKKLNQSTKLANRIMFILFTFVVFAFADMYISAMDTYDKIEFCSSWYTKEYREECEKQKTKAIKNKEEGKNTALLPNLLFSLGLMGYILFNYKKT